VYSSPIEVVVVLAVVIGSFGCNGCFIVGVFYARLYLFSCYYCVLNIRTCSYVVVVVVAVIVAVV
jgi:hypothetical protein